MTIEKAALRAQMHERRSGLSLDVRQSAAAAIAARADELLALTNAGVATHVSTYGAIGPELDPSALETELVRRGCTLCLPVMAGKGKPLVFRAYAHGDALVDRVWGIKEPAATAAIVTPTILMVPLLAFDDQGWRLGYGGGFYDRTLRELRASSAPVAAVGIGYDEQRVRQVPHADYDEPLDWVLTPSGLRRTSSGDGA
jgi:5-formyltetrahydrofolate cyclo-ligase